MVTTIKLRCLAATTYNKGYNMNKEILLSEIIYEEEFYPRSGFDPKVVEQYQEALDQLPPIVITHEKYLVDGYHRLIAHKVEKRETILVEIITLPKEQILWESVTRNAGHGYQLSRSDKRRLGQQFYRQGRTITEIGTVLSVSERTVNDWTKEDRKRKNDERNEKIWTLWMQCYTADKIAAELTETCKITQQAVSNVINTKKSKAAETCKAPESVQTDTIWMFQQNDSRYGMKYPGRIPGQIVENVLWAYTEPFDIVIDPMAGGGTTLDVCKAMLRRYQCYDLAPVRDDIKQHDITQGMPENAVKANLIFLDPPYWKQKRGDYSDASTNLANVSVNEYTVQMKAIFKTCFKQLSPHGHLAVIIGPTQENGIIYDHAKEFMFFLDTIATQIARIIVPYTTQQLQGFQVADAKKNRYFLKRHRDLLIYQKKYGYLITLYVFIWH